MHQVPVVRRSLLADPRRLAAGVVGVGLALMLVLLVTGLWAGVQAQVTAYEDHTGAQLFVVEAGTRTLFADSSNVPITRVAQARRTRGVTWAAPVRALYSVLELRGKKVAVAVVGYVPGLAGGPSKLGSGRLPRAADEVVVDHTLARTDGLRVGATFPFAAMQFRVVGVTSSAGRFMTPLVFVPHATTDRLLHSPGTTSTILVSTPDPKAVTARLHAQGMTVVDLASLRAEDLRLATSIYGVLIKVMVGVGFVAGTLIVALSAYSLVVERRREFGIIKAMGATHRRLTGFALGETLILAVSGFVASLAFALAARWWITSVMPQFTIVYTIGNVMRAGLVAVVMAVLAAILPARRLNRLDPAVAYRSD